MIIYKDSSGGKVSVYLKDKREKLVGYIKNEDGGFRYFPIRKYSSTKETGGELFPTLNLCKKSLEE